MQEVFKPWMVQSAVVLDCFLVEVQQSGDALNGNVLGDHFFLDSYHIKDLFNVSMLQCFWGHILFSNTFPIKPLDFIRNAYCFHSGLDCRDYLFARFELEAPSDCIPVDTFPVKVENVGVIQVSMNLLQEIEALPTSKSHYAHLLSKVLED